MTTPELQIWNLHILTGDKNEQDSRTDPLSYWEVTPTVDDWSLDLTWFMFGSLQSPTSPTPTPHTFGLQGLILDTNPASKQLPSG